MPRLKQVNEFINDIQGNAVSVLNFAATYKNTTWFQVVERFKQLTDQSIHRKMPLYVRQRIDGCRRLVDDFLWNKTSTLYLLDLKVVKESEVPEGRWKDVISYGRFYDGDINKPYLYFCSIKDCHSLSPRPMLCNEHSGLDLFEPINDTKKMEFPQI